MRLQFVQTRKTMARADFDVLRGGAPVGRMSFSGSGLNPQGSWEGEVAGHALALAYGRGPLGAGLPDADMAYRALVDGREAGRAVRGGHATAAGFALVRYALDLGGGRYTAWPFSLGRRGYRTPIFYEAAPGGPLAGGEAPFAGGAQVAELAKPCKVRDDLHSYELAIADGGHATACVLLCCYEYCQSWWSPGPAARHHTRYYIRKKSACGAGDAYDPGFMARVQD